MVYENKTGILRVAKSITAIEDAKGKSKVFYKSENI